MLGVSDVLTFQLHGFFDYPYFFSNTLLLFPYLALPNNTKNIAVSITRLYQLFAEKTDNETAEAVTSYVEEKVEREVKAEKKSQSKDLATKDQLSSVKENLQSEIFAVKEDLQKEIATVKEDLQKEIFAVKEEIGKKYADTIKWMFVFWIGTMGTVIAIMKLL